MNGIANDGGAIFLSGESSMYIYNSIFSNNQARKNGGAIYASKFLKVVMSNSTNFKDN